MNTTKDIMIGSVSVVAIAGGLLYLSSLSLSSSPSEPISNSDDAAVRAFVQEFGARFKNVSLLADDAGTQIALQYGAYASPDLIAKWQQDTSSAPGRQTSSPWPDRIEVIAVTPAGDDTYQVEGTVIEVINTDLSNEPAATYPVTLTVKRNAGTWIITACEKGARSRLPERVSIIGYWECLPHRDQSGPQTMECAFGIAPEGADDHHLGVHTMLMSSHPVDFPTGTKVRVEGVLTPMEMLSSDQWQKYDIDGIVSAILIEKVD